MGTVEHTLFLYPDILGCEKLTELSADSVYKKGTTNWWITCNVDVLNDVEHIVVVDLALPLSFQDVVHGAPDLTRLCHHLPAHQTVENDISFSVHWLSHKKLPMDADNCRTKCFQSTCCMFVDGTIDRSNWWDYLTGIIVFMRFEALATRMQVDMEALRSSRAINRWGRS
jgi:hypothetical protein